MKPKIASWIMIFVAALLCAVETAKAYYEPGVQRWVNRDPLEEDGGINLYQFVRNSPTIYADNDGLVPVETVLDVASICSSAYDLCTAPSWGNFGYLCWDIGATCIPYVPGSYTAKACKVVSKADAAKGVVKESVEEAANKKKHTPGRDHQTKSKEKKTERFQEKAKQKRIQEKKDLEDAWDKWNNLKPEVQKIRDDLKPQKPDPRCK